MSLIGLVVTLVVVGVLLWLLNNYVPMDGKIKSIINAVAIYKRLRSRSPFRSRRLEFLYVIQSTTYDGVMVYSKGKLITEGGEDKFYFLVSSKRAL